MEIKLAKYLGEKTKSILADDPFKDWYFEKVDDYDCTPIEVRYVFKSRGFEFHANYNNDEIHTHYTTKNERINVDLIGFLA